MSVGKQIVSSVPLILFPPGIKVYYLYLRYIHDFRIKLNSETSQKKENSLKPSALSETLRSSSVSNVITKMFRLQEVQYGLQ